jgi:hypothetical protein
MNKLTTASILGIAAMGAVLAAPAQAVMPLSFTVTLESELPGTQVSTAGFHSVGVETFNARSNGEPQNFTSNFGGSVFSGVYTGVGVNNADQYGGADGTGKYANAQTNRTYTIDLSSTEPQGVTYFGFWLSALDGNNNLAFYQGATQLFTFNAIDAKNFINGLPNKNDYLGNPNSAFLNQNGSEPYSFLNFYARGATRFDRIVFSQGPGGGYESDNHTVGRWSRISGSVIGGSGAVPEPATWAMLLTGFAMIGAAARRRKTIASVAA